MTGNLFLSASCALLLMMSLSAPGGKGQADELPLHTQRLSNRVLLAWE